MEWAGMDIPILFLMGGGNPEIEASPVTLWVKR